jgi:hypothetical protein
MFPPIEAYAVNFANGNLQPHVNPYGWPDFRLSAQVQGVTSASKDPNGFSLTCTAPGGTTLANSLYLVLPQPSPVVGPPVLPAAVRAFLKVSFDLPHATAADGTSVFTEPWAVSANLRLDRGIDSPGTKQVNVTSQFVNAIGGVEIDGVRLNTPRSLQQADQARRLDGPLDYARYRAIWLFFPAPVFELDHAFCGYGAESNGHTPGSGTLRIRFPFPFATEKFDHRVYSSQDLIPLPAGSTIGAVGVSVVTEKGAGTFGARLRSFRLWLDQELSGPIAPPVSGPGTVGPG